jgi:hypothetical protein
MYLFGNFRKKEIIEEKGIITIDDLQAADTIIVNWFDN